MGCNDLASSGILLEVRCDAEYFGLAGLVEAIDGVQWRAEQVAKEAVEKESELQRRAKQVAQTDEIMKDKRWQKRRGSWLRNVLGRRLRSS